MEPRPESREVVGDGLLEDESIPLRLPSLIPESLLLEDHCPLLLSEFTSSPTWILSLLPSNMKIEFLISSFTSRFRSRGITRSTNSFIL